MKRTAAALVLLTPAACTNTASFTVDGHVFTVPAPYVDAAPSYAFWADRPTSLSFTLNPQDAADAQHVVNVEPASTTCQPSRLAGPSPLASACAAAHTRSTGRISAGLARVGNRQQWSWRPATTV